MLRIKNKQLIQLHNYAVVFYMIFNNIYDLKSMK